MLARVLRSVLVVSAACAVVSQSSLPDPRTVPGPKEGDFTGVTRDGGGQGTGGLDPITYYADISISGWTPSNDGFTAGGPGVTMIVDLSTSMFPDTIRSQGDCNSCWALTATEHFQAVLTATQAMPPLPTGQNARLAAQEVIDCDAEDDGCDGGRPPHAFDFLVHHGVNLGFEYTYPVTGQKQECALIVQMPYQGGGRTYFASPLKFLAAPCFGSCPGDASKEQLLLDFWKNPPYTSNSTGQPVLLPLIAYVDASNWGNFTGGMFDVRQCSQTGDKQSHVVQVVGYGTDNGQPFWLIRNTWSKYWGENGHIRLPFGVNACGLFNYITYMPAASSSAPTSDSPNQPYPLR